MVNAPCYSVARGVCVCVLRQMWCKRRAVVGVELEEPAVHRVELALEQRERQNAMRYQNAPHREIGPGEPTFA